MLIMISKTMAKTLNAAAKTLNKNMTFTYCECGYTEYRHYINTFGYISGHDITRNNKIKYISVSYPYEYYALSKYITFNDLDRAFIPGDTIETFTSRIIDQYEI